MNNINFYLENIITNSNDAKINELNNQLENGNLKCTDLDDGDYKISLREGKYVKNHLGEIEFIYGKDYILSLKNGVFSIIDESGILREYSYFGTLDFFEIKDIK